MRRVCCKIERRDLELRSGAGRIVKSAKTLGRPTDLHMGNVSYSSVHSIRYFTPFSSNQQAGIKSIIYTAKCLVSPTKSPQVFYPSIGHLYSFSFTCPSFANSSSKQLLW